MPTSKPSRRAAIREAAQLREQRATIPELPNKLAEMLAGYVPVDIAPATWDAIRSVHAEVMARSGLVGVDSFRKHLGVVAKYLAYRIEQGMGIGIEQAFTVAEIDAYYLHGLTGSDRTRNDYRSRLGKLAARVNPGAGTPAQIPTLGHRSVRPPYTAGEEAAIRRAALRQRNPIVGQRLSAIVGLCGGAGLDATDLRHLHVRDITDHGDAGIHVAVPGDRARSVWVRRTYEPVVRHGIAQMGPDRLVIGTKADRRNVTTGVIARAELYDVAELDASRLRSTWLTWLLTRPVPIQVILDASGLKSARTLTELIAFLPDTAAPAAILRCGGK